MLLSNQGGLFLCLFVLAGAVLATCLHEFGHAIVAYWGGDKTVKSKGYLTLNPLKYTDVSTSLVLPIVFLLMGGFALPGGAVYINTHLLRGPAWKSAVSAAGPVMTAITALLLSIPFWLNNDSVYAYASGWFWPALAFLAQIEIAVLLLNLLPIPALDGYGILEPWLPLSMQRQLRGLKKYGFLFLLAMFWTSPDFSRWFWGASFAIAERLGIPQVLAAEGYGRFSDYRWLLLFLLIGLAAFHKQLTKPQATAAQQQQQLQQQQAANQERLAEQPDNYDLQKEQGQILLALEQYPQAKAHYSRALSLYPQDADFLLNHGLALAFQSQFEAAIVEYDKALAQQPKNYAAFHYKADALLELKRDQEALVLFDRILLKSPQSAHIWHDRGVVLWRLEREDEALTSYQKATYYDAGQDLYWASLFRLQRELGLEEESLRTLKRGLIERPKGMSLWQARFVALLDQHDYDALLESCDRLNAITNGTSAIPMTFQAVALARLQRYQAATAAFDLALEREPDAAWIRTNRVRCWIDMKLYGQALKELEQLFVEQPNDENLLEMQAHALLDAQQYGDAIALYERLLENEGLDAKDRVRLYINRGFALRRQGQLEAALDSHNRALEIRPGYEDALANRGDVLIQMGQADAGLSDLDHAVYLKPENPQLWQTRGDGLRELGQHQRALASYNQSLALKPDIEILCDKALCWLVLEHQAEAVEALQTARALDASTTHRTVAEKPSLAELWESMCASPGD